MTEGLGLCPTLDVGLSSNLREATPFLESRAVEKIAKINGELSYKHVT